MTATEMQYNFELKSSTLYSFDKPYTSYDINFLLNKAMDDIFDEKYSPKEGDIRNYFEIDEKLRKELGSLISNYNQTGGQLDTGDSALHPNGAFVTLPSDFLYSVKESCTVQYTDCNDETATKISKVKPVTHDEYLMNIDNPFKKPYNGLVWRMDYRGVATGTIRHELITDGLYTIVNYNTRYLKRPGRINILTGTDCQLHVLLHEDVVDRAVAYAKIYLEKNIVEPENQLK